MPRRRETYPFMGAQLIGAGQRPVIQPVLPIVLWSPDGSQGIAVKCALVDTGADVSMCPSKVTKPIGHKIRNGIKKEFIGAAATGKAWRHFVDISILTHDYRAVFHRLSHVPFDLVQSRKSCPVLLGRLGFLDQFIIHIDSINKLLTLEIP